MTDELGFGGGRVPPDPGPEPRAKDILATLARRSVVGDRLAPRIADRGFARPRFASAVKLYGRFGLPDPWDPTAPTVEVALGEVGLPERRQVAPHATPPPGPARPGGFAGGPQKDPFPNLPRAPGIRADDPFPNLPKAAPKPGIRPDDPFPNLPKAAPKPGIRPDDPFPNLPKAAPSGIRPDDPFPNLPRAAPKPGIRPDDPFPNLPPARPPAAQPASRTPPKTSGLFSTPGVPGPFTKHAVAKLPVRPDLVGGPAAPPKEPAAPQPPRYVPSPKPAVTGRPAEAPKMASVAASAGGVAATPRLEARFEEPARAPTPPRSAPASAPSTVTEVPEPGTVEPVARPPEPPRPVARPAAPMDRRPPSPNRSVPGGGLDDLFGMGGADTRIRMPKAEEAAKERRPVVATEEELAKSKVDRRPPPPAPPKVKPSGGGGGFSQEGM